MWCENCRVREAVVHVTDVGNGGFREGHWCRECAEKVAGFVVTMGLAGKSTGDGLLDRLVGTCVARGAEEVRVMEGEKPTILVGGERRELMMGTLGRDRLLWMVKAVGTEAGVERLAREGEGAWEVELGPRERCRVEASVRGEGVEVRILRGK